jgi:hypothetical protein
MAGDGVRGFTVPAVALAAAGAVFVLTGTGGVGGVL